MGLILLIILIILLVGAMPTWGYSRGWGYYPSGSLGLILIIVIFAVLLIVPNLTKEGRKGLVLATAMREPARQPGQIGECYGFSSSVPSSFNGDRRQQEQGHRERAILDREGGFEFSGTPK